MRMNDLSTRYRAEVLRQLADVKRLCPLPAELTKPEKSRDRRIRQNPKPLSNKLEANFGQWLKLLHPGATIWEQAITFRLANSLKYTPDWVMVEGNDVFCYEIKGPKMWDDAVAKLKMAASIYKQFGWMLCWRENGLWKSQALYP
jgi:hypothetical protein